MGTAIRSTTRKHRFFCTELAVGTLVTIVLVGVHLMFFFWPFRYRQVHPLLQQVFRSRVEVKSYHRTYFPHPGFVAEDVTFYRHGDMHIPPLAIVDRMTVVGTWSNLLFHPHMLYEIQLKDLHVQVPPPGTQARGMDFDQGVVSTSKDKLQIETIVANGTTLDFLRRDGSPLRFLFSALQIHNVRQGQPLSFFARVSVSGAQGMVVSNGSVGPIRINAYGTTPLSGTYSLMSGDLSRLPGVAGHVSASGQYSGTFSNMNVAGHASIPDFRAGSAHRVRFDSSYHVTVNGTNGNVEIKSARVQSGSSVIVASGSVAGSPKKVDITISTNNSQIGDLLRIVEEENPQVAGTVSFHAAVDYSDGPGRFLQRLNLKGDASLERMRFVEADTQEKMDALSARVRKDPPGDPAGDPTEISAEAQSATRFVHGTAYFPDLRVSIPGAVARLHGTFNLLDSRIHLTGKVALQKDISHAVTGWKSWLLKPLSPFFRHKPAGAVVAIAITGTTQHPKIGQDLLHDK